MGAQNEKPHNFGIKIFEDVANRKKVAQLFAHFFIIHAHKLLAPETDEG